MTDTDRPGARERVDNLRSGLETYADSPQVVRVIAQRAVSELREASDLLDDLHLDHAGDGLNTTEGVSAARQRRHELIRDLERRLGAEPTAAREVAIGAIGGASSCLDAADEFRTGHDEEPSV